MKNTIIALDDMPYWLERMKNELSAFPGYTVVAFASPREALSFFEESEANVALVVSDNQMNIGGRTFPNRGIELLQEIRWTAKSQEKIPLILFTSEASSDQRQRVRGLSGAVVLKKHSVSGELLDKAREVLGL